MTLLPSVLLTDLYRLAMLQAYHAERMTETAVFELFVRRLPSQRGFLVAAGLESALDYLENLRFTPQERDWLARAGRFSPDFLASLVDLRFTGEVHALPEGTLCFAEEPLSAVRERTRRQLAALPAALRANAVAPPYPVTVDPALRQLAARLDAEPR